MLLTDPEKVIINKEINGFFMDYQEIMIDKLRCVLII
jgi:hypothetical protein